MKVRLHAHAQQRLKERGASESEVIATVTGGERFPAKFGRIGFRRNFLFAKEWHGRHYTIKQLEVYAVQEKGWLAITVITKFF